MSRRTRPSEETPSAKRGPLAEAGVGQNISADHREEAILSFEVAGQRYGLRVKNVIQIIEMVEITRLPTAPKAIVGVIDFHGKVIPIIDLRRRLQEPSQPYTLRTPIVVSQVDERTAGLVVDIVREVVELLPQQIELPDQIVTEEMVAHTRYLAGVARLDDGLLLLLDPATLLPQEVASFVEEAELMGNESAGS